VPPRAAAPIAAIAVSLLRIEGMEWSFGFG
jgi:hypothetical protein